MRDRLLSSATALLRIVLVLAAFGLAVSSLAQATVRGFCPEGEVVSLAAGEHALATIVDPDDGDAPEPDPNSPAPVPDQEEAPGGQGEEAPGEEAPGEEAPGEDAPQEGGACPGGRQRCLPPLISSVLILGDETCNEEAPPRLRNQLLPAFIGATVLGAIAWWLRPSRLPWSEQERVVDR